MLRPNEPRVEEVNGSAWLIMGPTQSRRDPHHRACGTGAGRRRGTLQEVVRLYKSCVVELRRGVEAARSDGQFRPETEEPHVGGVAERLLAPSKCVALAVASANQSSSLDCSGVAVSAATHAVRGSRFVADFHVGTHH